jgi:RNA polymerase sigma factor (sigma-70 family)
MTDTEIIIHFKNNNYLKAVNGLQKSYTPIYKFVIANNGQKQDAEDVFQDALVILYNKTTDPNFKLTSALQTYLVAIAKNLWFSALRKKKPITNKEITDVEEEQVVDETQNYTLAQEAFLLLGDKCKELLQLFYFNKLDYKTIATTLNFGDEKTAKNQKYRCLQKAKEHYATLNINN